MITGAARWKVGKMEFHLRMKTLDNVQHCIIKITSLVILSTTSPIQTGRPWLNYQARELPIRKTFPSGEIRLANP